MKLEPSIFSGVPAIACVERIVLTVIFPLLDHVVEHVSINRGKLLRRHFFSVFVIKSGQLRSRPRTRADSLTQRGEIKFFYLQADLFISFRKSEHRDSAVRRTYIIAGGHRYSA